MRAARALVVGQRFNMIVPVELMHVRVE